MQGAKPWNADWKTWQAWQVPLKKLDGRRLSVEQARARELRAMQGSRQMESRARAQ